MASTPLAPRWSGIASFPCYPPRAITAPKSYSSFVEGSMSWQLELLVTGFDMSGGVRAGANAWRAVLFSRSSRGNRSGLLAGNVRLAAM